jgi:hypothetical protein
VKAEHRLVPYSSSDQRRRRRRRRGVERQTVDAPDLVDLVRTGFSHRNSLYFASNKRQRVEHQEEEKEKESSAECQARNVPARWQAGVDDIFQLFSKKK